MVAVVKQRKCGRPLILRKLIEALHLCGRGAVDQKAKDFVYDQRVVDALLLLVGLSKQDNGRAFFTGTLSPKDETGYPALLTLQFKGATCFVIWKP